MHDTLDGAHPPASMLRRTALLVGKIVVSVALLTWLFRRTDFTRLWSYVRNASPAWIAGALLLYLAMLMLSAWRWRLLLDAQHIRVPASRLVNSYLVATFFNNFLPSNIGGDVVRIRDTAGPAGSKTLATTIILMDRMLGLLGLVFVAAVGATVASSFGVRQPIWAPLLWATLVAGIAALSAAVLWPGAVGRMLSPVRVLHQDWVDERLARLTGALARFGSKPGALVTCFVGAIVVQTVLVGFYSAIAHSMNIPITAWHLAVVVPVSFVVQMAPVSLNGFGVREATFTFYFSRIGLPIESALVVSFMGAALIIAFSTTGAVAYLARRGAAGHAAAVADPVSE